MWFLKRKSPLFSEVAAIVKELKVTKAPGTQALCARYLKRLNQYFGTMPVDSITEIEWSKYVSACKKENPKRNLQDDQKYCSQVLLFAYRQGYIPRPIRLEIPDRKSKAGREITEPELERLFSNGKGNLRFQMEIALKMGLRLREMLYLRWERFSWDAKTIRLKPEDTKTRRGREVPIAPELFMQFKERFSKSNSPFVFPSRFDPSKPQHDNKTAWQALKEKVGMEARWHDFRHTCASRILRRGIPTSVAKVYLGMSEKVLLGIYHHLNLDDLHNVARVMSSEWKAPEEE